jgi:hypothetical protein
MLKNRNKKKTDFKNKNLKNDKKFFIFGQSWFFGNY